MRLVYANLKTLCAPWRFNIKTDRSVDEANSETFESIFSSFPFIVIGCCFAQGFFMLGSLFYS